MRRAYQIARRRDTSPGPQAASPLSPATAVQPVAAGLAAGDGVGPDRLESLSASGRLTGQRVAFPCRVGLLALMRAVTVDLVEIVTVAVEQRVEVFAAIDVRLWPVDLVEAWCLALKLPCDLGE